MDTTTSPSAPPSGETSKSVQLTPQDLNRQRLYRQQQATANAVGNGTNSSVTVARSAPSQTALQHPGNTGQHFGAVCGSSNLEQHTNGSAVTIGHSHKKLALDNTAQGKFFSVYNRIIVFNLYLS